ncbi:MAG: zinc-ribbon domain-containing protein [Solobacterium sp.]|nr:zinc-ribbon domain-containing protein [Solobacterium sp.]
MTSVKCPYCGAMILSENRFCPNCGAANHAYVLPGKSNPMPETIAELKEYCEMKKIPLKAIHFHIGENYRGARAIGIYRDGENVIVYKNKSDGSRFIRYQGSDEAYAVREITLKLKEVLHRFEAS